MSRLDPAATAVGFSALDFTDAGYSMCVLSREEFDADSIKLLVTADQLTTDASWTTLPGLGYWHICQLADGRCNGTGYGHQVQAVADLGNDELGHCIAWGRRSRMNPKDVDVVMSRALVDRHWAVKALEDNEGDVVRAILGAQSALAARRRRKSEGTRERVQGAPHPR